MNIHEDDIREDARNFLQRFFGGATGANASATRRFVEVVLEGGPEIGVVFNNCD